MAGWTIDCRKAVPCLIHLCPISFMTCVSLRRPIFSADFPPGFLCLPVDALKEVRVLWRSCRRAASGVRLVRSPSEQTTARGRVAGRGVEAQRGPARGPQGSARAGPCAGQPASWRTRPAAAKGSGCDRCRAHHWPDSRSAGAEAQMSSGSCCHLQANSSSRAVAQAHPASPLRPRRRTHQPSSLYRSTKGRGSSH